MSTMLLNRKTSMDFANVIPPRRHTGPFWPEWVIGLNGSLRKILSALREADQLWTY